MLEWFRSYLVIIAKEAADDQQSPRTATTISAKPRLKFYVYTCRIRLEYFY